MDVSQVLMSAQSPDPAQRQGAEQMLKQAEETNFVRPCPSLAIDSPARMHFMHTSRPPPLPLQTFLMQLLGNELINETKDVNARQLAGLTMKNCLTAKVLHVGALCLACCCCATGSGCGLGARGCREWGGKHMVVWM